MQSNMYPDYDVLVSGKYVGNRPIKLRKSKWKEMTHYEALEKQKVTTFFVNDLKLLSMYVQLNSSIV